MAAELIVQSAVGAATMLRESADHPVLLREAVTSPAGTTIAAIRELERHGVRAALLDAIEAARDRSVELGRAARAELTDPIRRGRCSPGDSAPDQCPLPQGARACRTSSHGQPVVDSPDTSSKDAVMHAGDRERDRHLAQVQFLTVAEVAAMMRVSKMTVYRLVHAGELPAVRVGRSFRVPSRPCRSTCGTPTSTPADRRGRSCRR